LQPVDTGIGTRKGNLIMSEQDETILNAEDTEGHFIRGEDKDKVEVDDTEGHQRYRGPDEDDEDDTEGNQRYR
jgi:hypothetical protein